MANVTVHLTGDEARLLRSLDKVIAKERKLATSAKNTGRATRREQRKTIDSIRKSEKAREKAFGEKAKQQLGAFAAKLAGIAAAGALVVKAFRDIDQAREQSAQKARMAVDPMSRLAQLAKDPAQLKRLTRTARDIFAMGGAETRGEAAALTFELASADALQQWQFFAQLKGVADPTAMVRSAAVLRKAMGPRETGGLRGLVSKGIAAAKPATGVGAEDVLQAAALSGGLARKIGISDEELLGMVSVVAETTGSGERAGILVNRILNTFLKKGVKRGPGGIGGMIGQIRGLRTAGRRLTSEEILQDFIQQAPVRAQAALKQQVSAQAARGIGPAQMLEGLREKGFAPAIERLERRRVRGMVPLEPEQMVEQFLEEMPREQRLKAIQRVRRMRRRGLTAAEIVGDLGQMDEYRARISEMRRRRVEARVPLAPEQMIQQLVGGEEVRSREQFKRRVRQMRQKGTSPDDIIRQFAREGHWAHLTTINDRRVKLSEQELQQYLGDVRSLRSYYQLERAQEAGTLEERVEAIKGSEAEDLGMKKIQMLKGEPHIAAARRERISRHRREIGQMQLGLERNITEGIISERVRRARAGGLEEGNIWILEQRLRLHRYLLGEEHFALTTGTTEEIMHWLELKQASENLNDATVNMGGGTTLAKPDEEP